MKIDEFDYELPKELIAQHPSEKRDEARLMIINKKNATIEHKIFKNIIDFFNKGDCLVLNNTRVIPARLFGIKENSNINVEFLLLNKIEDKIWEVMVKPGRRIKQGANINFGNGILKAHVLEILRNGNRKVQFEYDGVLNEILDQIGLMPLPPYITEKLKQKERYQTVYAKYEGSAAAPTAGLHFTDELINSLKNKGIIIANVTLHVGIGTFRPVKVENIEEHEMHSEHFFIKEEDARKINDAKKNGKKIIACGTTSCRVLETVADDNGMVKAVEGDTNIFIYPGYKYKCVDSLITNFHLPKSTLVMLVSALAGKENIMNAYKIAIQQKYNFFSFGDAMLIV